jgi:hypothetical protein
MRPPAPFSHRHGTFVARCEGLALRAGHQTLRLLLQSDPLMQIERPSRLFGSRLDVNSSTDAWLYSSRCSDRILPQGLEDRSLVGVERPDLRQVSEPASLSSIVLAAFGPLFRRPPAVLRLLTV